MPARRGGMTQYRCQSRRGYAFTTLVQVQNRLSHDEYLAHIERLAHEVTGHALSEGWLTCDRDDTHPSPLQRSINELARHLRHVHFEGDGCVQEGE